MRLTVLDWTIVGGCVIAITWFAIRTSRYMRAVADFLSANRSAGRYMLTMAATATGLGAISVVGYFEQYYAAGFPTIWWGWMTIPAGVLITLTGWVYYRFRETRCLTLAQFFEVRYSRRFRIFAGFIVWLSGIVNFAIFPYVASNFFVYFCGLPEKLTLLGLTFPTYWPIMLVTLGMALTYTLVGGHVSVMVTDCLQGIFCSAGFMILCVFLLSHYAWPMVTASLEKAPILATKEDLRKELHLKKLAWDEAVKEGKPEAIEKCKREYEAVQAQIQDIEQAEKAGDVAKLKEVAKGKSMLNPFDTGRIKHFSMWFFLILVFNQFYGMMTWQGSQAYQSSGISPHEQKMSAIIFPWVYAIRLVGLVVLTICALTFLTHPHFAAQAAEARQAVEQLKHSSVPQLAIQQRVPIALSYLLPTGLRGFFCVMMVFLLITTQDTYLHSWGSIFIQDVVLPMRKKAFSPEGHVRVLRWSITGVAIFAFLFACFYKPAQFVQMYFAITGAIISGLGCAIIGGLYWRYGGTLAAYVAMTLGAVLSVARIVLQQFTEQIAAIPEKGPILAFINYLNTQVSSQVVWFWIMVICIVSYVIVSLITLGEPFNLERMLHRGKYDIKGEHKKAADAIKSAWLKVVGITEEFTRTDRFLALALVIWNGIWVLMFFGAAAFNYLIRPIPAGWWPAFWRVWVWVQIAVGIPATLWFTVGAVRDMKRVFHRLATLQRDERDDGRVVGRHLAAEEGTVVATEDPPEQANSDQPGNGGPSGPDD